MFNEYAVMTITVDINENNASVTAWEAFISVHV